MIWIIAGTKNAKLLIEKVIALDYNVIATTSTKYGKVLLKSHENLIVKSKPLKYDDMEVLLEKYNITLIIDASHPFAENVSKNTILISKNYKIPYIRYERKKLYYPFANYFNSFKDAADYLFNKNGKIFLAIGVKNLFLFSELLKERIVVRVLSSSKSILKCEELGFLPDNIIGMKGTFSKQYNKALFKELKINYLLTKDSGLEGGTKEKIEAANELGIEIIIIKRPKLDYPEVKYEIKQILKRIKQLV